MNNNTVKLVFGLSMFVLLIVLVGMVAVMAIVFSTSARMQEPMVELQPGMVVKGSGDDVFYLTPAHSRRRIANRETLVAFGFAPAAVVKVDDTVLSTIPLAGELTRLVQFEQGNLYWVMDGQRWLVNEWQPVISQVDYTDVPPTPLDNWLQYNLPVRLNFERGMLLQSEGGPVYTYNFNTISVVDQGEYAQARIVQVPADVLAVYPRHHAPAVIARYLVTTASFSAGSGLK